MKQLFYKLKILFTSSPSRGQEGQSLVFGALCLMFILIGCAGLAVDVGLIMDTQRELSAIADGSALAAASALSESNDWAANKNQAEARAKEYAAMNGFDKAADPTKFKVDVKNPDPNSPRRLVQVSATQTIQLAFMSIFGFKETDVSSNSDNNHGIAEASDLDIVIVQDVSALQRSISHCSDIDKPFLYIFEVAYSQVALNPALYTQSISPCTGDNWDAFVPEVTTGIFEDGVYHPWERTNYDYNYWLGGIFTNDFNPPWQPFSSEQQAAREFVNSVKSKNQSAISQYGRPFDKVGLVSFSDASEKKELTSDDTFYEGQPNGRVVRSLGSSYDEIIGDIGSSPLAEGDTGDPGMVPAGYADMAAGIRKGISELTGSNSRPHAMPIMILVSSGLPTLHDASGEKIGNCDFYNPAACSSARNAVIQAAEEAQAKGITIYTILVQGTEPADNGALLMQWIADLTDDHNAPTPESYGLPGNFRESANNPNASPNYFYVYSNANNWQARANELKNKLSDAYSEIFKRNHTRIIR